MIVIKKFLSWSGIIFGAIIFGAIALWHILIYISVVIIFVAMSMAALTENSSQKNQESLGGVQKVYSDGRKTIESFGTRKEFVILRFSGREFEEKFEEKNVQKVRWSLYNRDKDKSIDRDIGHYERVLPCVYTKGERGYTKLNYETAEIQQNKDISEFSKEDQDIFKNLKRSKN